MGEIIMKDNFVLSEKRQDRKYTKPIYNTRFTYGEEDVKEFIRLLKEDLCLTPDMGICRKENGCLICKRIMELAGEKLK